MKKSLSILLAAVMCTACFAACGGSSSSTAAPAAAPAATEAPAAAASELSAETLANVDVTVEFGDYAAMEALSKDIQNGKATGKVVCIDGLVSNFSKGMSYSITEKDEAAGKSIGTVFRIKDTEEDAYPTDGTHVKLTGLVTQDPDNALMFFIETLPDFVEVLD